MMVTKILSIISVDAFGLYLVNTPTFCFASNDLNASFAVSDSTEIFNLRSFFGGLYDVTGWSSLDHIIRNIST